MYVMLASRPDLSFGINYLSRFQNCAAEMHWTCLKRILRYLRGTTDCELTYTQNKDAEPLIGYADADWGNDTDR